MLVLASAGEVTVLEQDTYLMLSTGSTQEDGSRHDEKLLTGTLRIKPKNGQILCLHRASPELYCVTSLSQTRYPLLKSTGSENVKLNSCSQLN